MTIRELRKECRKWQDLLGLSQWKIELRWATRTEAKEAQGSAVWHPDEERAWIVVSRTSDQRATLIHELLHVRWEGHKPYGGYSVHQERAINAITAALLSRNP